MSSQDDKPSLVQLTLIDFHTPSTPFTLYQLLRHHYSLQQSKRVKSLLLIHDEKLLEYDPNNFHLLLEREAIINQDDSDDDDNKLIDNYEFMMKAVSSDGMLYHHASHRLQSNYLIMLESVKQNGRMLGDLDEDYYTDELILHAVKEDGQAYPGFGHCNMEIDRQAVQNNGLALEYISEKSLTADIIYLACEENPMAREYLPYGEVISNPYIANLIALYRGIDDENENDNIEKRILKQVMKIHPESLVNLNNTELSQDEYFELSKIALQYSHELNVLNFKEFNFTIEEYEELVKYDGDLLSMIDSCYHTRRMIENAVRNNGALHLADEEFHNDHHLMREAIKLNPSVIRYGSEVKFIRLCVLEYVRVNGEVLEYVAEEYGNDREIVLNAVMNYGLALGYASNELQKDEEIVMEAIGNCGLALQYVDDQFYYNKNVILKAVSQNGLALEHVEDQDEEIIKTALNQTILAFEFVEKDLISKEIAMMVIEKYPYFYNDIKLSKFLNDRDVTMCAVRKFGGNLSDASEELKSDREIVLAAVQSCGLSLQYANSRLVDDGEIVRLAILNNPFSIKYASNRLRLDWSFARLAKELRQADLDRLDSWEDIMTMYKKRSLSDLYDTESEDEDNEEEEEIQSDEDQEDNDIAPPTKLPKLKE